MMGSKLERELLAAGADEVVRHLPWYRQPEDSMAYRLGSFLIRLKHMPGRLYQWVRYRTIDRYHVLDLRHGGYRAGWMDAPQKMEAALFACLVFFVEKEEAFYPEPIVDWDSEPVHRSIRGKALELYEWWTRGQYAEEAFLSSIVADAGEPLHFKDIPGSTYSEMVFDTHPRWAQHRYWLDRYDAKRKRMFQLLVDIREYLWV
jgi:hypothetical protein